MTEKEIMESNLLIAEFMGWRKDSTHGWLAKNEIDAWQYRDNYYFKYYVSWDWLMPVVEKIETIKTPSSETIKVIVGDNKSCVISSGTLATDGEVEILYCLDKSFDKSSSKIKATWRAVVEFIKWNNSQTAVAVTPKGID